MRIAQWDILEFSRNPKHKSPKWPAGYWPDGDAPPDAKAWDRAVKASGPTSAMQDLVADPASDLFAPIPGGEGQTLLREPCSSPTTTPTTSANSSSSAACSVRGTIQLHDPGGTLICPPSGWPEPAKQPPRRVRRQGSGSGSGPACASAAATTSARHAGACPECGVVLRNESFPDAGTSRRRGPGP